MLSCADIMVTIVNYDDMILDCQIILEACYLLSLSPYLTNKWVTEYLSQNLKIEV